MRVRREEAPFAGQNGDVYVIALSDFAQGDSELKVSILIEGIELLGLVQRDDRDTVRLIFDEDGLVCHVE